MITFMTLITTLMIMNDQRVWVMWHAGTAIVVPAFVFVVIWMIIGHTLASATGDINR